MKKLIIAAALVCVTLAASAQNAATRIANLEAPLAQIMGSNTTSFQLDFRQGQYQDGTNGIQAGEQDYQVTQLNTNITLYLTNLVPGVRRDVFILADGTAHQFSISTNGLTSGTRVSYNSALTTNGSYALSITNRARITLVNRPSNEVQVNVTYYQ